MFSNVGEKYPAMLVERASKCDRRRPGIQPCSYLHSICESEEATVSLQNDTGMALGLLRKQKAKTSPMQPLEMATGSWVAWASKGGTVEFRSAPPKILAPA